MTDSFDSNISESGFGWKEEGAEGVVKEEVAVVEGLNWKDEGAGGVVKEEAVAGFFGVEGNEGVGGVEE